MTAYMVVVNMDMISYKYRNSATHARIEKGRLAVMAVRVMMIGAVPVSVAR